MSRARLATRAVLVASALLAALAASCAPMGGRTATGPGTVPVPPAADPPVASVTIAADTSVAAVAEAESSAVAAPDTASAPARAVVETRSQAEARKRPEPVPPLNISAANVTGSRGGAGDVVMLNGDVRITRGRTVITADNGRYERTAGMLYLDDRVRLVDSATVVTCDHASYSEERDLLWLTGRVSVHDRAATLRAPTGTYERRTGRADLGGGVEAEDTTQTIRARSVTYWRELRRLEARGAVEAADLKNRLTLRADSVDYDRVTRDASATGAPELESVDDQGRSTFVRSRRMRLNTETRVAVALDSVRIVRDTLEARADSARFDDRAERGWLLGHPSARDAETTVTGDTLEIWTERRELRRFVVMGAATIDYRGAREATIGEASRLTGNRVDVFFRDERMDSLVAIGAARNAYTAVAREGKTPESNLASGDTIVVHFRDRKIHRARVNGRANGEYRFAVDEGDTVAARVELVRYEAPTIEFRVPEDLIVLRPKASLRYKEMSLKADEVQFDSRRQTLVARGDPELVDKGDRVVGDVMSYDIESQSGTIYEAETDYEKGKYRGHQIRKVGDDVLNVQEGTYTTCDLEQPHYHFSSKYMKIMLKDKLVARPVIFYVKHVPMMALPFWVFPIRPGRHSGFLFPQVEFGFNSQGGQFVRNAGYYWAPNEYFDLTFSGDYYRADPSFVLKTEGVYRLLYRLNGGFNASYRRNDRPGFEREDYSFTGDHGQELTPRTRMIAGGQFVSSRDYQRDPTFGSNLGNRLNRFLTSKLYLTHNADWANFTALVDRRQDLDADQGIAYEGGFDDATPPAIGAAASLPSLLESAPLLSVAFPTRSLGSFAPVRRSVLAKSLASLYVSLSATVQRQHERRAVVTGYAPYRPDPVTVDSTTVLGERDSTRSGGVVQFSVADSRRLFGWLNLSPRFSANGALFDRDVFGSRWVPTGTWSSAFSSSATFYGTFAPRLGPLVGLRHVLFPSLSYSYSPDFPHLTYRDATGVLRPRFSSFGSIGVSGFRASAMSFSLDQRLQAKLRRGDDVVRLDNLLSWTTSGSYNFLWREQRLSRGLSNLVSSMRLQPPGLVSADAGAEIDPFSERPMRRFSLNLNANFSGSVGAGAAGAGGGGTIGGYGSGDATQTPYSGGFGASPDALEQPWTLGLAYSYSGGYVSGGDWGSTRYLNATAGAGLTRAWRLDYLATYDFEQRTLLTQHFSLTRDLHCWFASFSRTFIVGGESEYYFRIGLKDLREIYYERGSRVQNFGGIR